MDRVLLIWGGLIFAYLILTQSSGASTVLSSLTNFVTGTTSVLQGGGGASPTILNAQPGGVSGGRGRW